MGLLDDAIREHLELKRRRGADETEVARQEHEAFGPPRRGEVATETVEEPLAAEHEPAPALDEPATFAAEEQTALHVVPEPEDHPVQEEPPPLAEPPVVSHEEHPVQDEPPRPHGDPADTLPEVEQPTRAFDADELRAATTPTAPPPVAPEPVAPEPEPEHEPAPPPRAEEPPEEEPEGEDVLEETPEFLQETPEHDRLWFEQRPPRDFDF